MAKVVVVDGASSGIGRATAKALAERGDKLVLVARRGDALEELRAELGADADVLVTPADVTDDAAMEEVAQQAVAQHGRIDAWIHCAAVGAFGHFLDVPVRTLRRVVDVTLVGSMLAARAALRVFQAQREGTLVLVSSVDSAAPIPYLTVYDTAKGGVATLAMALRGELTELGYDDIKVVDVRPPSTDTPFFTHAANYVGRKAHAPPPAYDPDTVAKGILDALDAPEDVKSVGLMAKLQRLNAKVLPGLHERLAGKFGESVFLEEPWPVGDGAVFEPMREGRTERQEARR